MSDQEKPKGILGDLPKSRDPSSTKTKLPALPVLGLGEKLPFVEPPTDKESSEG